MNQISQFKQYYGPNPGLNDNMVMTQGQSRSNPKTLMSCIPSSSNKPKQGAQNPQNVYMNNSYINQQKPNRDLSHKPFQSPVFGEQCGNNSGYIYNDVY